MRKGGWLQTNFFSESGVGAVFFRTFATFQRPVRAVDEFGDVANADEGSWEVVPGYEAIPAQIGPEVTGRPASSTEYQNSGPLPFSDIGIDYLYLMLKGYYPGVQKSWRVIVDGELYSGAPTVDGGEGDIWGVESDSQHTFSRFRIYKQKY